MRRGKRHAAARITAASVTELGDSIMTLGRKRIIIASIIVLSLFALFSIWALVDALAPDDADLRPTSERIPDSENAFTFFADAVAALDWPTHYNDNKRLEGLLVGDGWDDALAADTVARNEGIFDIIEQGLAYPQFQVPEIKDGDTAFLYLTPWRESLTTRSSTTCIRACASRPG
ncbi:MAG: hypothetical protein JW889_02760 [Verrucomicrobia bacterium]|nr:hypothetical protein [Verrucomicrobiota bacterium]